MISCVDLLRSIATVTLFARLVRQFNTVHSPTMDASYPHIGSCIQSRNIVELRSHLVRRAEKILLASDDEDTGHQNGQGHDDESS